MPGIEAAFAIAKNNFHVALISLNKNKLAMLPCNPSIGTLLLKELLLEKLMP